MKLPNDPIMLMSVVNTYLRDKYSDLDELCSDLELDRKKLEDRIAAAGYLYDDVKKRFV